MDFITQLNCYSLIVEDALRNYLDKINTSEELKQAMRYSCLGGGKRLRAILIYGIGNLLGASDEQLHAPACAVECIHTYSLIHDDLPAMDNSPLRRGKPSCHIAYNEAIAILAGDALQAFAFELLATSGLLSCQQKLAMINALATACGANGMVGGQAFDIAAENKMISLEQLGEIHRLKTGALLKASILLGAIAAKAQEETLESLEHFATHLGLAYQIQDDLLDATGQQAQLGKPNSDTVNNKNTYTRLLGIPKAQHYLQLELAAAYRYLAQIAPEQHWLFALIDYIGQRNQ